MIEVRELCRTYRVLTPGRGVLGAFRALFSRRGHDVHAVQDVSFTIGRGEFVGYVGPNGAGKSSTLKMLTGILVPTSGEVRVCGRVPHRERTELARRIGVVFGQRTQLWWDLPASEGFRLLRHIYDVDETAFERRLGELTDRLELAGFVDAPVRKLSLGQKMRCELAGALLHGPEVLFLDEPTIGLDVVVKEELHRFLRDLNERDGVTVLLTSHDLDDIERLCRRVMVIDAGRLLHDGDLASLHDRYGHVRRLSVTLREASPTPPELPAGAELEQVSGRTWTIAFQAEQVDAPTVVRSLLDAHDVVDLAVHEASIEDVVKRIYRGEADDPVTR